MWGGRPFLATSTKRQQHATSLGDKQQAPTTSNTRQATSTLRIEAGRKSTSRVRRSGQPQIWVVGIPALDRQTHNGGAPHSPQAPTGADLCHRGAPKMAIFGLDLGVGCRDSSLAAAQTYATHTYPILSVPTRLKLRFSWFCLCLKKLETVEQLRPNVKKKYSDGTQHGGGRVLHGRGGTSHGRASALHGRCETWYVSG